MLDLTTAYSKLYQVKLFDGTVLSLYRPTQKLQKRIIELQKLGSDSSTSALAIDETFNVFTEVINRNKENITFNREELEEDFDYSVALLVIGDYLNYYAKEIARQVNFQVTQ